MIEILASLYKHMQWADASVLDALERADVTQRVRALEIYAHVLGAEHVWLKRLKGEAAEAAVWPDLDVVQCRALMQENTESYRALLATLAADGLGVTVSYVNSAGVRFDSTIGEILTHVAMHGHYHRGQVALLLRSAGAEPASTDYIAFTRGAPAATRRTT